MNLIGNFEGYFIIIIFQFYILHYFVVRYKISVEKLLPVSILIMIVHLWIVNHTTILPPDSMKSLRLLITGWIGYFTIGFLIGKHYDTIKKFLKDYKWTILILFGFSIYFMFLSFSNGNIEPNSKRIDIFIFTITICLLILAWGQVLPNLKIVNLISNYSLGIYLLHWQVLSIVTPYVTDYFTSPSRLIIGLFIVTMIITMILIKLISLLPFGKYIIGNTKRSYSKKTKNDSSTELNPKTA